MVVTSKYSGHDRQTPGRQTKLALTNNNVMHVCHCPVKAGELAVRQSVPLLDRCWLDDAVASEHSPLPVPSPSALTLSTFGLALRQGGVRAGRASRSCRRARTDAKGLFSSSGRLGCPPGIVMPAVSVLSD